jgi:hypothetical protein
MATKRRGGLRTPELRGTLGTLLRTTTGVVRDALERGAREGRARLDDALSHRRRDAVLAELGDLVLDLIRRGEIDLAELPEARDLVRQLDDLDADPADEPAPPPRAPLRRRFDDRSARPSAAPAPAPADDADPAYAPRPRRPSYAPADDGTVSSGASAASLASAGPASRSSRPTIPARPSRPDLTARAPTKPIKGIWRPDVEAAGPPDPAPAPRRSLHPHDPSRKGGIDFDDDDLTDYMHPDDVPPKADAADPDDGEA